MVQVEFRASDRHSLQGLVVMNNVLRCFKFCWWHSAVLPVLNFERCQIRENCSSSQPDAAYSKWRRSDAKKIHFSCPAEILPCAILIPDERHKNPIADALFGSSESDTNHGCFST